MEPAVLVDGFGSLLGHLVIALHDIITAREEFTVDVRRTFLTRLGIDDLALDLGQFLTDGVDADFDAVLGRAHGTAGRRLGLSVDDGDLGHVHLIDDLTHFVDRTG